MKLTKTSRFILMCSTCIALALLIALLIKIHLNNQKLNNMKKNMGNADRIIRILLAIVFAALYFTNTVTGTLGLVLVILGAVFLLTSLISFCPLYTIFGINTCGTKKSNA